MQRPRDRLEIVYPVVESSQVIDRTGAAVVDRDELTEVVMRPVAQPAAVESAAGTSSDVVVAAAAPTLPELVRVRLVQASWYRAMVDTTLRLDQSTTQQLREHIAMGTVPPEDFRQGSLSWKYALLTVSQRKPFLLFGGLFAWLYTLVYWALKLTFLV